MGGSSPADARSSYALRAAGSFYQAPARRGRCRLAVDAATVSTDDLQSWIGSEVEVTTTKGSSGRGTLISWLGANKMPTAIVVRIQHRDVVLRWASVAQIATTGLSD
jgi:hypothetical protein